MIIRTLLVEDNAGDVDLFAFALEETRIAMRLKTFQDGRDAQRHLDEVAGESLPYDLIVLDLNLPRLHGLELLAFIKGHPLLAATPTVVLTSSNHPNDRRRSLDGGADAYFVKPSSFDEYAPMLAAMAQLVAV